MELDLVGLLLERLVGRLLSWELEEVCSLMVMSNFQARRVVWYFVRWIVGGPVLLMLGRSSVSFFHGS